MVHLNLNHAVSIQRTAALMQDFFGLTVSQATVVKAAQTGAGILQATRHPILLRDHAQAKGQYL